MCGRQNDVGMHMVWFNDHESGQIRAEVSVPEHFNGYPGVVHGGIVAAILDETAGRALLLQGVWDDLFVTLKLEVKYRRPTPTGVPLMVHGWVVKRGRSRAKVAARISLADGTVTAEAEAIVVHPPPEFNRQWEPEKPFWRVYPDD